jgi:BirA family biotin operon repressor/biotin-[acetyl-CoA-carboxylase] ligase
MLFRPELPLESWHLVAVAVALAARDACADEARVELQCKWPNDLQSGDRKVAGILAEAVVPPGGEAAPALVVGIGINCNWPADWPSRDDPEARELLARATSLDRVAGRSIDRDAVADRMLDRVGPRYAALVRSPSGASVVAEYRRNLSTIGRRVRVELADDSFSGTAVDVDAGGHLVVDVDGSIRNVAAGDVVHLR